MALCIYLSTRDLTDRPAGGPGARRRPSLALALDRSRSELVVHVVVDMVH